MNRLQNLKKKRQDVVQRMETLLATADEEDRDLTEDEQSDWDELDAERQKLDARIEREQAFLDSVEQGGGRGRSGRDNGDDDRDASERQDDPLANANIRDQWQDDPMLGYDAPSDFLLEVMEAPRQAGADLSPQLNFLAAAGSDEHGGYTDPHGGFFIPEGMSPQVLQVGTEGDPTEPTPVPMDTETIKFNARVDKNHTSSVSGGLTVSRRSETQQPGSSRQEYEQVKLEATGLYGLAYVTEQLLERSPRSFAALLEAGFQDEFATQMLRDKLHGTGAGEPMGVLQSPALITVAKEGGQSADTIVGNNIIKMRARCWRYSRAIWLANHDAYEQLVQAHIAGSNSDVFLFSPARGADAPDTLLGRPIFFTEFAKTLGDKGDLILGNWSQYLWGTLGSRRARRAESVHVRFLEHERTFKFWLENDGQPWWRSALTPAESSDTLSPFVTLAERG